MLRSIQSIRPLSVAPVFGALSFLAGCLAVGIVVVSAALTPGPITSSQLSGPINLSFRGMPPVWMMIAWPFITGACGALTAVVGAWLYNRIVPLTGPVQVTLAE